MNKLSTFFIGLLVGAMCVILLIILIEFSTDESPTSEVQQEPQEETMVISNGGVVKKDSVSKIEDYPFAECVVSSLSQIEDWTIVKDEFSYEVGFSDETAEVTNGELTIKTNRTEYMDGYQILIVGVFKGDEEVRLNQEEEKFIFGGVLELLRHKARLENLKEKANSDKLKTEIMKNSCVDLEL